MLLVSPFFTVTVCEWKSSGFPIPYRQDTLDITMTSRLPDSSDEAALRRSFSISSFMLRSLLYVCVRGRDICFRLVIIVVGDEILHGIVREERLELPVELGRKGLVVAEYEGRTLKFLYDVGHRESLS